MTAATQFDPIHMQYVGFRRLPPHQHGTPNNSQSTEVSEEIVERVFCHVQQDTTAELSDWRDLTKVPLAASDGWKRTIVVDLLAVISPHVMDGHLVLTRHLCDQIMHIVHRDVQRELLVHPIPYHFFPREGNCGKHDRVSRAFDICVAFGFDTRTDHKLEAYIHSN